MSSMTRWAAAGLLGISAFALAAVEGQSPAPAVVADAEILDELKSAPGDNLERVNHLVALYEQAGAPADAIRKQAVPGPGADDPVLYNVIVTKPGKTDAVIVVGGHLDKVRAGDGIIDDWSGACLATNLYQAIREVETEHTFVFVGFAYEERGLLGSRKYVDSLAAEEKARHKAMVNLECLGVGGPFLWTNGSTDVLEALAHEVAVAHGLTLEDHVIRGVGADSIPFEKAGIPNITFDGLPSTRLRLIHTKDDTFANIDPKSYTDAYKVVLRYLIELDKGVPAVVPAKAKEPAEPKG